MVDPHAYFNAMALRPDCYRQYSLRSTVQVPGPNITYAPEHDTDPERQDAAKVTIPPFVARAKLMVAVDAVTPVFTVNDPRAALWPIGRVLRLDSEIVTITARDLTVSQITVARARYGTVALPHAANTVITHATNSVDKDLRLSLQTTDNHTYFAAWEAYWTPSFIGAGFFNHKAFQFSSGGQDGDTIWQEPQVTYNDPAVPVGFFRHQVRSYNDNGGPADWALSDGNQLGPGTSRNPLQPYVNWNVQVSTWTRFYWYLDQRHLDYDPVSMWVADEHRGPVQTLDRRLVSVRPTGKTPNQILKFWLEFNTSEDEFFRTDLRNLVVYVRNLVVLRDPPPSDIPGFLLRPLAGTPLPPVRPRPPGRPIFSRGVL